MAVKNIFKQLDRLPTFTYTKLTREQRRTIHKAVSFYKDKKIFPRRITETVIDIPRWKDEDSPDDYPSDLHFPRDILKATLYGRRVARRPTGPVKNSKNKKKRPEPDSDDEDHDISNREKRCASCRRVAHTISAQCNCTTTPWHTQTTEAWRQQHIDLRWVDETHGIGAYALTPFAESDILGEYVGELVPDTPATRESRYLFGVMAWDGSTLAFIDSLRVGSWTRFVNHSCEPNASYELARVGREIRVVVEALKQIGVGEEITSDYGDGYWEALNEKGVWCGCGVEGCKYGEDKGTGAGKSKKAGKKNAGEKNAGKREAGVREAGKKKAR